MATYHIVKQSSVDQGVGTLAQSIDADSADAALTIWATTGRYAIGSLEKAKAKGFVAVTHGRTRDGSFSPVWEA